MQTRRLFGSALSGATWRACTRGAAGARRSRAAHRRAHSPLLFRSELENIFDEELGVVLVVSVERGRSGTRKSQAIVFALEKSGRHRGAGADGLRVDDPALDPIGLEAPLGCEEVGRGGGFVVGGIAGGVTFQ